MERCIIVGAGGFKASAWCYREGDYVIAADGGYDYLRMMGIVPNLLIGDMDSLMQECPESGIPIKRLPVEKDDTDMMAAIKEGLALGFKEFFIYGALGGKRLDHSLANIQCLLYLKNRGANGILYGEHERMELLSNEKRVYPASMNGIFSAFAYGEDAKGVTEQGLKYTLQNAVVKQEFPIGISNEFIGQKSMVEVTDGSLLIYIQEK